VPLELKAKDKIEMSSRGLVTLQNPGSLANAIFADRSATSKKNSSSRMNACKLIAGIGFAMTFCCRQQA